MDRETLKNRILAICIFVVGLISIIALNEATFFMFCFLISLCVWITEDEEIR